VNRSHRAFDTTVVVSAFSYAAMGLSLFSIPIYLTTLGTEGYGLMVTVMATMGYFSFADAGLSWGSMILVAQASGRGNKAEIAHIVRHSMVLAAGSGLVVLLGLGGVLACAGAGWRLPMFAHHPEADRLLVIAAIQVALNLQFSAFYNLLNGLQEGYLTGIYQGLGRILGVAGSMLVAWRTRSVAAVMLVQFGFMAATGAAAVVHVWLRHPWVFGRGSWVDPVQYRAQLRIGAKNLLLQVGRTLVGTAPTMGISSIVGPAAVPFFTVPTTLLTVFFVPVNSWNASMQSAYGEAWTSGSREWTRGAFRKSLERTLLVGGLGVALFFALGDPFIRVWTHSRLWLDPAMAASVAAIVVVGALVTCGEYLLTGLNRHRRAAVAELANGLCALVLAASAVRWIGYEAVGAGTTVAALITSVWVLRREIHGQLGSGCFPQASFVARICAAAAVTFMAAFWAGRSVAPGDFRVAIIRLAIGGLAGLAVFIPAAFVFKLVGANEAAAVRRRLVRYIAPLPSE
jgi:O-antigen/teichoic acid export membrane protein